MNNKELSTVAEAVKDMCNARGETVSYNGQNVDIVSALRSPVFSEALIEIGWCSLNLCSPGMLRSKDVPRNPALMAHILDYAVEVSPRLEDNDNIIEMGRAIAHAAFLTERVGKPEMPKNLVEAIGVHAQKEINRRGEAPAPGPGEQGAE